MHSGILRSSKTTKESVCGKTKVSDSIFGNTDSKNITKLIIGDFGLSHILLGKCSEKTSTYTYRAPEVYKNIPYDEKIDIWSCGVCLIYFLTGDNLYNLSINDSYFVKKYYNYIRNTKKESIDKEKLYEILITDFEFKTRIIKILRSKKARFRLKTSR